MPRLFTSQRLAAQHCPEDVLRLVYAGLSKATLAVGALVCRGWFPVCMTVLYDTIEFPGDDAIYATRLRRTLTTSETACMRITSLRLETTSRDTSDSDFFYFLSLFNTSTSLRQLYVIDNSEFVQRDPLMEVVLSSKFVHSVTHLMLAGEGLALKEPDIYQLLSCSPSLLSFAISNDVALRYHAPAMTSPVPPLQRICLQINAWEPALLHLLPAVAGSLSQLYLRISLPTDKAEQDAFTAAFSNLHGLTEFLLDPVGLVPMPPTLRIFNSPLSSFEHLRHLCVNLNTFSASPANVLPNTIENLWLRYPPAHNEPILEDMRALVRRSTSLRRLFIIKQHFHEADRKQIADICRESDVDFLWQG